MENLIENLKDLNIGNRGTGAGVANTNKSGKEFEQTTDIVPFLGENFSVEYGFCLCDFFKQPKYKKMLKVLDRQEIRVFFASDQDYFNQILRWVGIPIED